MQIFAEVYYLYKRFCTSMTSGWNIWDIIAIVITPDILHNNFHTTTASLLKTRDKKINQIQSIL